jgi:hypothetical protein
MAGVGAAISIRTVVKCEESILNSNYITKLYNKKGQPAADLFFIQLSSPHSSHITAWRFYRIDKTYAGKSSLLTGCAFYLMGGDTTKSIKCDLDTELKSIELVPFAGLHKGDQNSLSKLILQRRQYVIDTPNAYAIWNGDLVNWASIASVSDTYGETLKPMEQIASIAELIDPVKGKTLCIQPGNHEFRPYKTEGIDITRLAARQLGIEDKYSDSSTVLFVRLGKDAVSNHHGRRILYTIYINHGGGGGRKPGAKASRLADMASIVDADVYIHSHTHMPLIMRQGYYRTDTANSAVTYIDKLFVNTGATLEYGGYGEAQEFTPSSLETPIITLNGIVKRATATL